VKYQSPITVPPSLVIGHYQRKRARDKGLDVGNGMARGACLFAPASEQEGAVRAAETERIGERVFHLSPP
jgi:hypothetical protein